MKQAPGALYIGSGKEGANKVELDAKVALLVLEADDQVVARTKTPAGANSWVFGGVCIQDLAWIPRLDREGADQGFPQRTRPHHVWQVRGGMHETG